MPGVDMARLRDMTTEAPCLRINGEWAWWPSAAYIAVPIPRRSPRSWSGRYGVGLLS